MGKLIFFNKVGYKFPEELTILANQYECKIQIAVLKPVEEGHILLEISGGDSKLVEIQKKLSKLGVQTGHLFTSNAHKKKKPKRK